jgi:hypothetical protein
VPAASPDLIGITEAVEIQAADRFLVAGEPCSPQDDSSPVKALSTEIYQRLYTRAGAPADSTADLVARRDHLVRLSEANCGRGTWEHGWTVRSLEVEGQLTVERDGLTIWATADSVRSDDGEIAVGARCRVKVSKELRELQPGFYIAIGDGDPENARQRSRSLVRIYWHLTASVAEPFIRLVTARLNVLRVPFRAKVLSDPSWYRRADAGVLYLDAELYPAARRLISAIYRQLRGEMLPEVPLFTRPLAPGLAVAEDPGGSESFGQHRSRLVAQGLWNAFAAERSTPEQRLQSVVEEFQREGLDPRRPHLSPGARGSYRPLSVRRTSIVTTPDADWLAAACRIGDKLCRSAYWHEGRCGWMGRSTEEADASGLVTPTTAALGADLYKGTAGVALFLAQLHGQTGDSIYRETARGAILQALGLLASEPPLGFFGGRLGVAWAAQRVARLTASEDFGRQGEQTLRTVLREIDGTGPMDLLIGHAGAILVLLSLARDRSSEDLLQTAAAFGDRLCGAAEKNEDGTWAWSTLAATGNDLGSRPLTGLSHGTAGMALALWELFAATDREDFRDAAGRAFAYEDRLFDAARGNWPDFRQRPAGMGDAERFSTAWCHGAPGIALARLRASQLDLQERESHRAVAAAGLATTARALAGALRAQGGDTS